MQPVANLVEQRARVVERQQRRLAVAALGKFMTLTTIGRMSPASFSWSRKRRPSRRRRACSGGAK